VNWDLIIFDCDGVLVDSEPIQNRLFYEMLVDIGWTLGYEETVKTFIGCTMADCLEIAEQRRGRALPSDFEDRLQARTFAAFEQELRPVPGVIEALNRITAPVCVASSGSLKKIRKTLGLAGLLPRFENRMFSATQVERGKPCPDLFLFASRELSVAPAACAVIEDSLAGVKAGVAAGMTVFGYVPSMSSDALKEAGARVFSDMKMLPDLIADDDTA
jgi:HAD superfamily hydrolase (TIGR01509 family)